MKTRNAIALTLAAVVGATALMASDASAAGVLCQREKNGKTKIKIRVDACKNNETLVELMTPLQDEVREVSDSLVALQEDLETRVALAEEAATAPVTNDRLDLERETIRVPGVEGERSVTTEGPHQFCGLTRVLYFPSPTFEFPFLVCEVNQNDDGTWTIENGNQGSLFCDVECF